jgi:hypothetical protein
MFWKAISEPFKETSMPMEPVPIGIEMFSLPGYTAFTS